MAFPTSTVSDTLQPADVEVIFGLRLLVARAAATDSLNWWEDQSMTEAAAFVLDRTFPHSPPLAARSLAVRAAIARHRDAAEVFSRALHLYDLDWQRRDRLALRGFSLLDAPLDLAPVASLEEYRRRLLGLTGEPARYRIVRQATNGGFAIRIPPAPAGVPVWRHRAAAFAWAYLEGRPGRPAIPLIIE